MFTAKLDNVILLDKQILVWVKFASDSGREINKNYNFPLGKDIDLEHLKADVQQDLEVLNANEIYVETLKLKAGAAINTL
jgi:hypothetical protein